MKNGFINTGFVIALLLMWAGNLFAQIGGNPTPLYTSEHRYQVSMSNISNSFTWSVYDGVVDANQIDEGSVTPMPASGYFSFGETDIDAGNAYVFITFNGLLTRMPYVGYAGSTGKYTLAYSEVTTGDFECDKTLVYSITLYPPLDIDIEYISSGTECSDSTGVPQQNIISQTTRNYNVNLVYPSEIINGYSGNWYFTMTIDVVGDNGVSSTVDSVNVAGSLIEKDIGLSSYSYDYVVADGIRSVSVKITYNDVLSFNQDVIVELSYITGSFSERDDDEINKTQGNIVTHKIYAMPDVGEITAWN